jgi:hypothetical protein
MRPKAYLTFALITGTISIGGIAESAVNCDEVLRSLKAGASSRDVADTMAISIADVKDCQDRAEVRSADGNKQGGTTVERSSSDRQSSPNETVK